MNKKIATVPFFKAYLRSFMEVVMILPILYFLSIMVLEDDHRFIILGCMVLYPIVGIVCCKLFRGNKVLRFVVGFVVIAVLGEWINRTFLTGVTEYIVNYVLSFALFYRSMMYAQSEWIDLLPPTAVFVIIAVDFLALLVIGVAPALEPYRFAATVTGPFIIIGALFVMNYLNMKQLADTRTTVSKSGKLAVDKGMNVHNRLWVGILFIAVLLLSTWQNMIDVLQYIVEKIIWLIMKLMDPGGETGGGGGGGSEADTIRDLIAAEEQAPPNPFLEKLVEIFAIALGVIFAIVMIALLVIIAYKVIKGIAGMMKNLMDKEGSLIDDMGYVDTRESIMNLKDVPREYLNRLKDKITDLFAREPKYSDMETVEQKATWLYRHTVIKSMSAGYKYKISNTATETLSEIKPDYNGDKAEIDFIDDAYNRVKFSETEPDVAEVDKLGNSK